MMARKRKAGLTDPQIRVLEVLDRFQRKAGYPPSIREIKDKAQLSSTSVVNYYLDQLEEMGYIERDEHVSRGIRLIKSLADIVPTAANKARQAVNETFAIPVIGRIFASEPVPVPASDFQKLHPTFFCTSGNATVSRRCAEMGDEIGAELKKRDVDAVIFTST